MAKVFSLALAFLFLFSPLNVFAGPSPTDLNNSAVQKAKEGRFKEAIADLRQAVTLAPNDAFLRKNLSLMMTDYGIQLEKEDNADGALQVLSEAVQHFPDNGLALAHLGNIQYLYRNDFDAAIAAWQKAYPFVTESHRQALSTLLKQAERDRGVERKFLTQATAHFQIRIADASQQTAALRVGDVLERHYQRLAKELGVQPAGLTVIIYSQGDFQRLANRTDWALGFYDGRIRLRLEDVEAGREVWILPHELAHAFLHKAYGARLPIWIHEGYAQAQEPERPLSTREQEYLKAVYDRTKWVPLQWLDSRFAQPGNHEDVDRAYAQAKVAVAMLLQKQGSVKFKSFLEKISQKRSVEDAFNESFAPLRFSRFAQGSFEQ